MKIGLELEYWVIDDQGKLVSSKQLTERVEFAEQEFVQPLIEVKTAPYSNTDELKNEVKLKLEELLKQAEKLDLHIVPLGTPLNSGEINILSSRRGEIQQKIIGENLEAAKRVAGTHIHFEKQDVREQLNTITALDPVLAVTNSSPYYQGERIASSSRNQVYRYQCYEDFPEHGQLWEYVDSEKEWQERITQRFHQFTTAGITKGISEKELHQYFEKENALWTPVRLRKQFPTIEWRAPDTGRIEDVLHMAEEMKDIVESNDFSKPSFNVLSKLSKKAIDEGLQNKDVREYLDRVGFTIEDYNPICYELKHEEYLSREEAREIRLKYSKELEKSIETL